MVCPFFVQPTKRYFDRFVEKCVDVSNCMYLFNPNNKVFKSHISLSFINSINILFIYYEHKTRKMYGISYVLRWKIIKYDKNLKQYYVLWTTWCFPLSSKLIWFLNFSLAWLKQVKYEFNTPATAFDNNKILLNHEHIKHSEL